MQNIQRKRTKAFLDAKTYLSSGPTIQKIDI